METIFSHPDSLAGILVSMLLLYAGFIARKYVIPFLQIGRRQRYAVLVARLADEVTDDLRERYPENEWLRQLDEAVDKLIELCGVSEEVAQRAVRAAVARRKRQ